MRFLLIHPEISRTKYNFKGIIENECLELEYISAILKNANHQVYIYDGQVEEDTVSKKLVEIKPDVIYVCGRTRQENFMLEYCKTAKEYNENIITIIGGLHSQLCYKRMYKPYVDYILTSFNIFNILKIISPDIDNKEIEGLCYKENGKWLRNPSVPFDINTLPLPDRTYFYEHPSNYQYLELKHAAWVRTAYCCPYRCKFCSRNKMNCGKYSYRDIKDVVSEIENIQSENIYIVDDDFLYNKDRLLTFISLVKERGIKKNYICYGRADFIASNPDIMKKLKEIGLYYVLVGLESIENSTLNSCNKKSSVDKNIASIDICNNLDINIMGMFILSLDFESKDFKELYKWIKSHNLKHVAISIFTPEIDTETYIEYKDRLITDNPSHWDYLHVVAKPSKISIKRYYFNYYILLIKLFLKAQRDGIYDFINYREYIVSFVRNIFARKRSGDDK